MSFGSSAISPYYGTGNSVSRVELDHAQIAANVFTNILRWLTGQISGSQCCKSIVDTICTATATLAGGWGGAAIGSIFGPLGFFIGGMAGGFLSGSAASCLSNQLTEKLFGVRKEKSLENAFTFFGLKPDASNNEINRAFRKMCLKYHPDKGGNDQDFHLVQINYVVIKVSKGETR